MAVRSCWSTQCLRGNSVNANKQPSDTGSCQTHTAYIYVISSEVLGGDFCPDFLLQPFGNDYLLLFVAVKHTKQRQITFKNKDFFVMKFPFIHLQNMGQEDGIIFMSAKNSFL